MYYSGHGLIYWRLHGYTWRELLDVVVVVTGREVYEDGKFTTDGASHAEQRISRAGRSGNSACLRI